MKKTISRQIASLSLSGKTLLSLLLLTVWKIGGLAAQVSISGMTADYPSKRISFTVTWTSQPYNNQIWVIADYVRIENNAAAGSWSRAPLLGITVSGSGTAATVTGDSGFILNTTGSSGSARVTAMTNIRAEITQFNWCAHAFHYPPAATVNAAGGYDL
ncbi:MAG: hypothetical protein LBI89_00335, partial [Prevotellaceae bacterium]|nr:hypothetical protein [Prevotellaceae bacterium]